MAYFELRCGTCSMFYENIHDQLKAPKTRLFMRKLSLLIQKTSLVRGTLPSAWIHFAVHFDLWPSELDPQESWVKTIIFECIKFYFRIKKYEQKLKMCYFWTKIIFLDGHLMTFRWRSSTTWWSWFWGFWSWFWVTIWFGNATIWLVRTSIIRLTTWSTTWSLLTSLFIFKSWFVALNLEILEFKYHIMTHNWWLIRMNFIWLTYLGGGVHDFFGCENS